MIEPTLMIAFVAGVASFASPCMLPVIPAFFAQLAGTSLGRAQELGRRDLLFDAFLFMIGFSFVFAVLGVALNAALDEVAAETLAWLSRLAGAVIVVLGLHMMGLLRMSVLDRSYPARPMAAGSGRLGPLLFGPSFAVAWTPCVGPILGTTLTLAATSPGAAYNSLLAYSLGLGLPFLITGAFFSQSTKIIRKMVKHLKYFNPLMGAILIILGILVLTNQLSVIGNFPLANEIINLQGG